MFKVPSADLRNHTLLEHIASKGKPVIFLLCSMQRMQGTHGARSVIQVNLYSLG